MKDSGGRGCLIILPGVSYCLEVIKYWDLIKLLFVLKCMNVSRNLTSNLKYSKVDFVG